MSNVQINLIESWLAVCTCVPGRTAADALRDLNDACGTRYTHSQLSKWRRGDRAPQPRVMRYMLECCIDDVLTRAGNYPPASDEYYAYLVAALSPPTK